MTDQEFRDKLASSVKLEVVKGFAPKAFVHGPHILVRLVSTDPDNPQVILEGIVAL